MRDVFEEIFAQQGLERGDPIDSARRGMRALRRRFYEAVAVRDDPAGFAVVLDGRPIRTPARRALAAPCRPLADAIAAEWQAQAEFIDAAGMPVTRLANTIIDGVAAARDEVAGEIVKYLGSDLVCYRAASPQGLVARQSLQWDPIIAWAEASLGAKFATVQGITYVRQPDSAIDRARAAIPRDPWRLGAVHAATTLTGSALIALALARGDVGLDAAWAAAHVDEDWNMELWGRDELALKRRAHRFAEMTAAARVLAEMETAG
ncbi:MAG TPA: ATP12 family protein [Xanthobacteraceae bacterium]|nr:ATP12 family protein [Xanthobacteraceae bacterium]